MTAHTLVAWPLLVCVATIFGTTAFAMVAVRGAERRAFARAALAPFWRWLATAAMMLSPVALLVVTASMADRPLGSAVTLVPQVIRHTHAGRVWACWLLVMAALAGVSWAPGNSRFKTTVICGLAAVLLLLRSMASHAIDKGAVAVAVYFVHMSAGGLWLGALAGLWIVWWKLSDGDWLIPTVSRVSRLAGWSVIAIVLSGLYAAYNAIGVSLGQLIYSAYGRTLLVKVAIFGLALGIGCYNRYWLLPETENGAERRILLLNVAVECALLVAVLGMAALLSNTPPPH
jgi:copper resistance protein D